MKPVVLYAALFFAVAAIGQHAPIGSDPDRQRERIAAVQVEITRNQAARERIERELRDLQAQIDRLRVEQQRLSAEQARLQSGLVQLQTAPR